jgi:hypothetical protein
MMPEIRRHDMAQRLSTRRIYADASDYFRRMRDFDMFVERLAEDRACEEGPVGFRYYDVLYRAVCLGETNFDLGPGPYYPLVLAAHHLWRRGDICRACVLLEKAHGANDADERTAVKLFEAAIREGAEGVRRIKTEDSPWSWASLFKDLLIAELDPRERAEEALRRIRRVLELVKEASDLPGDAVDAYNIFQPYISRTPYVYLFAAAAELERRRPQATR